MKKNGFLTFCCACFPGFGQMYQGYMKRGVSLAAWFWGIVTFLGLFSLPVFGLLLPVLWAYSFFDTFNIRSLTPQQRAVFADEYLPSAAWLQKRGIVPGFLRGRGGKIVGWACVGLGIYMLYANFVQGFLWNLASSIPALYSLLYNLPTILVAVLVIWLGLWMLGKNKNKKTDPTPEDDTTPFKGE
ncbi:hypothetical protein LJC61_06730 [Ruminococcaceae bacterium OttesenSCG-928-A16]|nr:hypothetical protein [Ruminococcaceae bacterium OttesenSCG-928-A16]